MATHPAYTHRPQRSICALHDQKGADLKKALAQIASALRAKARRDLIQLLVEENVSLFRAKRRRGKRRRKSVSFQNLGVTAVALQLGVDQRQVKAWLSGRQTVNDQKAQRILSESLRVAPDATVNLLEEEVARFTASLEQVGEWTLRSKRVS